MPPRMLNNLMGAWPASPQAMPKATSVAAKQGWRYERKVVAALREIYQTVDYNSWFGYKDLNGPGYCCPDAIIHHPDGYLIAVEVKLTWVPEALPKLQNLYIPIISTALQMRTVPLIIVKNTAQQAPTAHSTLNSALQAPKPLLQWLGNTSIFL